MNPQIRTLAAALLALTALASSTLAQSRPGIDRPIRVGMFKGTGTGSRYWHTNIHTSHSVMADILANPGGANLGPDLDIPPMGFTFYSMPVARDSTGMECAGSGCGPTPAQITEFVLALDTLDVMILSCVTDFGTRVTNATQRQAVADFWTFKGYVGIHTIIDQFGTWAPLDTIHGVRFRGHPPEHQNGILRRDSVFQGDFAWQYLNRGIFSNGLDTTLFEEWLYFTTNGATIRAKASLKPTVILDETSIVNPGSQQAMGDHPMSWYRPLSTGGRFFYTAVGHRADIWENARFFRRQVYNAILWTAKYDSLAQTVSIDPRKALDLSGNDSRFAVSTSALSVSVLKDGPHAVEVLALDGRRITARRGSGRKEHGITNLQPGMYVVSVTTDRRHTRLVTIP